MPWTPATAYCCAINVLLIIETALEHYCGNACPEAHPVVCPEACPEACPVVCPETSFGGPENLLRRTGSGPVSWEAIFTCEADGRVAETGCTGPLCQLTGPLWQLTGPLCQLTGPPFQICFFDIREHLRGHLLGRILYGASRRLKTALFANNVFLYLMDSKNSACSVIFSTFYASDMFNNVLNNQQWICSRYLPCSWHSSGAMHSSSREAYRARGIHNVRCTNQIRGSQHAHHISHG